jgi:hypothetical protein
MDAYFLLIVGIVICFVVGLVVSWPRGYNAGTIANAIGLVLSIILLIKPA